MRRLWSAATKATVTLFLPDANKNSRIPKKIVGIPHGFSFSGRWEPPFFPSGEPGRADGSARADEAPVPSSLLRRAFGSGPVERRRRPFVRICGPRAPSVGNARAARSGPSGAHLPRLFPGRDRAEPRPALLRKTHLFRRRERRPCDFAPQKTEKKFFLPMTMQKSC